MIRWDSGWSLDCARTPACVCVVSSVHERLMASGGLPIKRLPLSKLPARRLHPRLFITVMLSRPLAALQLTQSHRAPLSPSLPLSHPSLQPSFLPPLSLTQPVSFSRRQLQLAWQFRSQGCRGNLSYPYREVDRLQIVFAPPATSDSPPSRSFNSAPSIVSLVLFLRKTKSHQISRHPLKRRRRKEEDHLIPYSARSGNWLSHLTQAPNGLLKWHCTISQQWDFPECLFGERGGDPPPKNQVVAKHRRWRGIILGRVHPPWGAKGKKKPLLMKT